VRVSDLEVYKLLAGVLGLNGGGRGFDGGSVADTVEAEDGRVAFADAEDVVLEVGAGRPWELLAGRW
jgi:hypothetical protein